MYTTLTALYLPSHNLWSFNFKCWCSIILLAIRLDADVAGYRLRSTFRILVSLKVRQTFIKRRNGIVCLHLSTINSTMHIVQHSVWLRELKHLLLIVWQLFNDMKLCFREQFLSISHLCGSAEPMIKNNVYESQKYTNSKIIQQDFCKYKFARHLLLLIYAYKRLGSKRFLAAETLYCSL